MYIDLPTIRRMADEIRAALGEDHDADTFLDTLDGETDAADIADKLLADMLGAEAMGEAIRGEIADLTARRNRFDARGEAIRSSFWRCLMLLAKRSWNVPAQLSVAALAWLRCRSPTKPPFLRSFARLRSHLIGRQSRRSFWPVKRFPAR